MNVPFNNPDKRRFGRRATNWSGLIVTDNGRTARCTVKDCSVGGALLELFELTYLPFRFILEVDVSGFRSLCEVRHHRDRRVGVEFVRIDAAVRVEARNPIAEGLDFTIPPPYALTPMSCGELRALVRRS